MLTIPHASFSPESPLPPGVDYIKGQLEEGGDTGYKHWQLLVHFIRKVRLRAVRDAFGNYHAEPTRSAAASDYVWKEDTRVAGTQFEKGELPIQRSKEKDWDKIRDSAIRGALEEVPSDIFVRCYNQLSRIRNDNLKPVAQERTCFVFWGATGTGKSRRAWDEASLQAYPKDPNTKWWCGYQNHENVVIDEFRGSISISHLLRWLDRYPVIVETKGGALPLSARTVWITSNVSPRNWYPDLDYETTQALLRRLKITQFFPDGSTAEE